MCGRTHGPALGDNKQQIPFPVQSIITKSLRTIKTAYQRRSHVANGMNGWQRSDAQNVARSLLLTERKNRQKKKKRRKKHGLLTGTA